VWKPQILPFSLCERLGKSAELNFDFAVSDKSMTKSIVLTGATRGLGLAMTRFFAAEGHMIHGCGRDCRSSKGISAPTQLRDA